MPGYRRYFAANDTVFLTIVTGSRRTWLCEPREKRAALCALNEATARHVGRLLAYVLLDDHLHCLLHTGDADVGRLVSSFKRKVSFRRREAGRPWGGLWQKRFYDHVVRDRPDFERHLDYIHYNPVKHGYVRRPCDYGWSSFSGWARRGMYEPDWGSEPPTGIAELELE